MIGTNIHLRVALDEGHKALTPLRTGELADPGVAFDFVDVKPITRAFAPMVRDEAFDLSEMAIVTALQAIAYRRPIILLPIVLSSRFQRQCLIGFRPRGLIDPAELAGRHIGVRAFTQTTGMWVRAALFEDYGVRPESIHWHSYEPAHVPDYANPSFVQQNEAGEGLPNLLRQGRLDAAIMGNDRPDHPDFAPLIPDHEAADRRAYERHGFMPVNHMVAVSERAAKDKPETLRRAYRLLCSAIDGVHAPPGTPIAAMTGFDRLADAMRYAVDEAVRQALIPRRLDLTELFDPARRLLQP